MLVPWKKSYDQPTQHAKKQRPYFANKAPSSQGCDFSCSHVWMWELDYKKCWVLKNWWFWTVVLEKTLERVPWTARRSNQSILKEISPGSLLEGLMLKLKLQYFGCLMRRADAFERPWCWERLRQEEKGMTEDEMVGWHHWLNGHEFGWTPGVGDGQGGLACCSPWGHKESDMTEQLISLEPLPGDCALPGGTLWCVLTLRKTLLNAPLCARNSAPTPQPEISLIPFKPNLSLIRNPTFASLDCTGNHSPRDGGTQTF